MEEVSTDHAPKFDLPFSQATILGETVYTSGQVPVDPETGAIVGDDIREQTAQTMENIQAVLEAAGTSLDNAVKATVFLDDIDDFEAFNETYREYVSEPYPSRSAYEVSDLAIEIVVEIEMIAEL